MMDKFKAFLTALKKYQFWATCGVVLLTAIVCWWVATIGLAGQFKQRATKLEHDFSGVKIETNHPNQGVIDKIHQQNETLRRGVYSAWEVLYKEQKEKNPIPKLLGEDFRRQFENLKPKEDLDRQYRETYQNFIKEYIPTLLKIVDVRRPAEEKETAEEGESKAAKNGAAAAKKAPEAAIRPDRKVGGGFGPGLGGPGGRLPTGAPRRDAGAGGAASEEEWVGTVEWNDADYRALEDRFEWKVTPSTLAVVLAQEDLWVYEALLRVLSNTNEGATGYATAAVKRIVALEVGRDAARAWKDAEEAIFRAGQTTGASGATAAAGATGAAGPMTPAGLGGMRPGMEMGGGLGAAAATSGAGTAGEDQDRRQLIESRYVDKNGRPLPYETDYPYAKHPYAEFKMMPIRMNLVMDQRRLPKLLVECANSNMPIEVRRIRITKSQGGVLDVASASVTAGPGAGAPQRMAGMFGPAGRGMEGPMRIDRGQGAARPTGDNQETGPFDIPVEIHGVIYIYNPPVRQQLGTGAASAEKPAEATVPGGSPPAAPAGAPPRP